MSDFLQTHPAASFIPDSTHEDTANSRPSSTSQKHSSSQSNHAIRKENTDTTVENETALSRSQEQRSHPKNEGQAVGTDKDLEKGQPAAGEKPKPTKEAPNDLNLVCASSLTSAIR